MKWTEVKLENGSYFYLKIGGGWLVSCVRYAANPIPYVPVGQANAPAYTDALFISDPEHSYPPVAVE